MGRGAWMIPLLGQWALQLVENQLAMLLEYAQRRFERMEHRLSNLQGVANIQRVLEDYALASDVGLHVGNVTVGLGKMAANHRLKDTGIPIAKNQNPASEGVPRRSAAMARAGPYVSWRWRLGPARFGSYFGGCSSIYRTSSMPAFGFGCCDCCHRLLFEEPIIFWTADLRVTVSTRIVLVMTLHAPCCAVASPGPSRCHPAGRGANRDCCTMPTRRHYLRPNPDRRRALELLAGSRHGYTKAILRAHGFSMDMMVELVEAGLATTKRERMVADGRQSGVVRVRITDAGRHALAKMSK